MVHTYVEADAADEETCHCEEVEALTHVHNEPYRTWFHIFKLLLLIMEDL